MRTIPLALIALAALSLSTSLSTTGARAEGTWWPAQLTDQGDDLGAKLCVGFTSEEAHSCAPSRSL